MNDKEYTYDIGKYTIDFIEKWRFVVKNSIVHRNNIEIRAVADRLNDLLQILKDKEVSE